ncbi:potassium channel subfamily K member 16-like [Ylistrum balloti]|uniref:potassium channel subfamily K member 16-like n=1 Tax=Ylistrum balloti TaxID=509963 RepID=UPI00290597BF|nr:potassium channel subfamily K member 16-like [Ylistrum balloti]
MDPGPTWKKMLPLSIVVVVFLCTGALVFSALEGDPELERRQVLREYLNRFLRNHTCIDSDELHELLSEVDTEINFALRMIRNKTIYTQWDFSGSFSFVITVVTTIGYGNLAPRTGLGKVAVVVFAFIGIPITMIMISYIGQLLTRLSKRVNKCNLCSSKPMVNKVLNIVLIITLGITMLFGIPAFIFNQVEKWDFLEGLYYCFVTLSTIGFGDYIAAISENRLSDRGAGDVYRVVTYVWILFGLSYLSLVISYITEVFIKKAEKMENFTKNKFENEINKLQDEITKTKRTVQQKASTVKTSVNRKMRDTHSPKLTRGDAFDQKDGKNGVQLLRVTFISEGRENTICS